MVKKICIFLTTVLIIVAFGASYSVKASGDEYVYMEVTDETGTTRKAWFKNEVEISGNPGVIEEMSKVTIDTTPDDSCASYLATFYEPTTSVVVNPGVTVTFGSEKTKTSIQGLTCYDSNVTVYGEGGGFKEDGSLPGSVYGVTCFNSTIIFYGNIQYLCLGDEFKYDSAKVNKGNVVVNGLVYDVEWHTTSEYSQGGNGTEYYRGFKGNATVSGAVGRVNVYEIKHSDALGSDTHSTIGEGHELPSFAMTNGELSSETRGYISTYNQDIDNFYYEYTPLDDGGWIGKARNIDGSETHVVKNVTASEIHSILNSGTEKVVMDSLYNAKVDISNYNLSELKVYGGEITVNNVTSGGNGLLMVHSYGRDNINVNVNGDVDRCTINFTRANENMNINVKGTVKYGEVYKFSLQSDFPIYLGSFTSTNMPIFTNGVWNPDLFLSLGTTEYHPVDESLLDEALDLEKDVQQGEEKISEMADMIVEEMESTELNELENDGDFNTCVDEYDDVEVLTGVDILLEKYDYNETTGEVSNQEVVTELGDKELAITVKVPEQEYEEGKEYIIVREHDDNGNTEMDVLVPIQDGDKLTFETNKFSSFIIVEVNGRNTIETPTEDSIVDETVEPTESDEMESSTEDEETEVSTERTEKETEETTTSNENDDEIASDKSNDDGDKKNNSVVWWIVGGFVVISISAAVVVILYKRNKKKNAN